MYIYWISLVVWLFMGLSWLATMVSAIQNAIHDGLRKGQSKVTDDIRKSSLPVRTLSFMLL